MGCFLGCFGSSKDGGKPRKRSRNKVQPRDHQVSVCIFVLKFDFTVLLGVLPSSFWLVAENMPVKKEKGIKILKLFVFFSSLF
jgi:hypothetical protein